MAELVIRKAELKDVPDMVNLWKEFMKYHDGVVLKENPDIKVYVAKNEKAVERFRVFLKNSIKSRNSIVYVAEVNNKPVGYILGYVKDNIRVFKLKKLGYISDLFVKPKFHGKGIGAKLKNHAMKWFKKKGLKHVSLMVYKDNKIARSIYERWGFFDYRIEMIRKI